MTKKTKTALKIITAIITVVLCFCGCYFEAIPIFAITLFL